ncbi:hypothetical protein CDAR_577821 [Caerostris darwini]|uniref:Uncharacterized protein n=1 Tax=Caerostris darwini TaxID=1538125 RepID=A0AAV4RKB2_9ARAC|nr:hypothetical protein CDAR_577821 [Caerostris darwini]
MFWVSSQRTVDVGFVLCAEMNFVFLWDNKTFSEGMYHLTLLLTFNGIKYCAEEQPYPELDLIGFSDFQLL